MESQKYFAPETVTDKEIITKVLNGDKELYAVLVRRYNQRLYRIAMSILDNDAEAEDVMQTAYINAYMNLAKFTFRSEFSTWLTRILINESLLRVKKKKRSVSMTDNLIDMHLSQQQFPYHKTPEGKTINGELREVLQKAIQSLPDKYRNVFVMREIEGMNVSETKQCLGISEVNVKVRLNRAKAILRDLLSSHYKKEDVFHFHLTRCDLMITNVLAGIKIIESELNMNQFNK